MDVLMMPDDADDPYDIDVPLQEIDLSQLSPGSIVEITDETWTYWITITRGSHSATVSEVDCVRTVSLQSSRASWANIAPPGTQFCERRITLGSSLFIGHQQYRSICRVEVDSVESIKLLV